MTAETFFANFGHLADAPNGVQKLREFILQLAVQGKLVAQDPSDEPASFLFERIAVEKKRLVNEGQIKKWKSLPLIMDEEIPFSLPESWSWHRLGELGITQTGTTPKKGDYASLGRDYPFIKPANIYPTHVAYPEEGLSEQGAATYGRVAPPGSILMVCIGTIGKSNIIERYCSFNQQINSISPYNPIDSYYLKYSLRSSYFQDEAWERSNSTTIAILNKGNWESIPVPLPPFEEQKRIVAKVDQLMTLCDELEARQKKQQQGRVRLNNAALDALLTAREPNEFADHWQRISTNFDLLYDHPETIAKLRAAILQLAVQGKLVPQDPNDEPASVLLERIKAEKERLVKEKIIQKSKLMPPINPDEIPFSAPVKWGWEKIERLSFVTKLAGFEYTKHIQLKERGDIPVVRAQNVRMARLEKNNLLYIDRKTSEILQRSALTKPCLLMTFIGAGIGDVAIFEESERWHLAPNVAKLEPYNGTNESLDVKYLFVFLMSETGRKEIFKHKKATAQPSLSMGTIRDANVAVPPIEEQKRIVAKVDQLMALCDELETKLNQAQQQCGKLIEATVQQLLVA